MPVATRVPAGGVLGDDQALRDRVVEGLAGDARRQAVLGQDDDGRLLGLADEAGHGHVARAGHEGDRDLAFEGQLGAGRRVLLGHAARDLLRVRDGIG